MTDLWSLLIRPSFGKLPRTMRESGKGCIIKSNNNDVGRTYWFANLRENNKARIIAYWRTVRLYLSTMSPNKIL